MSDETDYDPELERLLDDAWEALEGGDLRAVKRALRTQDGRAAVRRPAPVRVSCRAGPDLRAPAAPAGGRPRA